MKRGLRLGLFVLSVFMLIAFPSLAESDEKIPEAGVSTLGNIGDLTSCVDVSDGRMAVGDGKSVILLKTSAQGPDADGIKFSLPAEITDLKIAGDRLYAAVGSSGLYIIDIKDTAKPMELGHFSLGGAIEAIRLKGTTLYAADSVQGLLAIDASDPAKPRLTGQAFKGKAVRAFDLYPDAIYIAAGDDGFLVADISKPGVIREEGAVKTPGYARDVALWGGYAFVAADAGGISLADIAGPPGYAGSIATNGRVYGLERVKNLLYAADTDRGLLVYDISSPSRPGEMASCAIEGVNIVQMVLSDNTAYCVDHHKGIICLDISDPSDIKVIEQKISIKLSQVELLKPPPPPVPSITPTPVPTPAPKAPSKPATPSNPSGTTKPSGTSNTSGEKIAYITIDDGPSRNNTPAILDILKEYGIKATFFVLPNDKVIDIYKRILDEGHVIGNHSYSHDYDYLYSSVENFRSDVLKARNYIQKHLNYTTTLFRFPGGAMGKDKDMIQRRAEVLNDLGYTWFDWNSSTGDADSWIFKYKEEEIVPRLISNVLDNTGGKKKLILLMHDSSPKTYTVKALPKILDGLIKQGYRFDVLTNY